MRCCTCSNPCVAAGAAIANKAGLGLGLYICSEIVKAHGGTVGAHSEGRQTVFTVKLPKSAPAASAGLSPAA